MTTPKTDIETRLLNRQSMAKYLSVSTDTLDGMRKRGCPTVPVPGSQKLLFDPDDVIAWMRDYDTAQKTRYDSSSNEKANRIFGN
jgi:hypothetical protein